MNLSAADERLRRALALFRELVDLDPAQRAAALAQRCADDADLCAEVERLCAADAAEAALDRGAQALPAAHGEDPRLGRAIGPYRLDAVLGEGGMGTVFRATRVSGGFAQQVALKLIRGGFDDQLARQRFERERTILARLAHPDLVPLLDGGVAEDGAPWYAMPLIEGLPVTQWCDARRLTLRERVALAARLCDAVQVAHQALIVHRDLKPSNILVDERGAPHLLDFGIAKLLDDADPAAETATRLMTPAYAAPEQIRGEAVSTATDVFALGVILYELVCGRHPFGGEQQSAFALQRAVIDSDPHRLSAALGEASADAALRAQQRQSTRARLRRELQGDLNRIAQKALAKRPQDRYGSAAALGDDLRRWLAGEPVQATPTSLGYRARKFLGRWRWTLAGAAVVLLSLLAATAISVQQARIAREAQRAAEANAQSAEAAQRFLQGVFLAAQPWSSDGAPPDALQLADRAFETLEQELAGQAQARADLYHSLSRLYATFGSTTRARQAAERAAALYQDLPASSARRFEVLMQQAYAQGYDGQLDTYLRSVAQAASLPGLGARERFVVATALAQGERERGRYDRALEQLQQASALADALPSREETSFALGNAERMLRRHADAARDFLRQDRDRDNSASRGWRALMAIYRFDLLPEAQRRAQDLQLAADLEAERAAVWPGGTWRELFTALRARLHLQHGDVDGALALARGLPLTERAPDRDVGGYDAEFWLSLSFILLNHDAQARGRAAQQFERIARALQRYSAAQDPRPLLARVGAACARGAALEPGLQAALAQPPQPDYLGYAWLRDAPCPALRDSAAARHPDPQARAHGIELRAALDQAAARLGECQRGLRVAVGAPCAATAP